MQFAAIDFETASGAAASACSLGVAVVEGGTIVSTREWLIHPPELYFSPRNVAVHGITPQMVAAKPEFDALWPEVEHLLAGRTLVAHNAPFDMGVLRATWMRYAIPAERMSFLCSVALARRAWPEIHGHSLGHLAQVFGIQFRHHNAEEDAATAARLVLRAGEEFSSATLEELLERTDLTLGEVAPGAYKACRRKPRPRPRPKLTYQPLDATGWWKQH
ncbi:MAG: 3'-5' exonuclease [Acidobacteriota bacterium]|nr:3'-5' exonuclease [Acidobacteriota bacterium]